MELTQVILELVPKNLAQHFELLKSYKTYLEYCHQQSEEFLKQLPRDLTQGRYYKQIPTEKSAQYYHDLSPAELFFGFHPGYELLLADRNRKLVYSYLFS